MHKFIMIAYDCDKKLMIMIMYVCEGAGRTLRSPIHAVCIRTAGPS